ncbi:bifunctional riboflavin kinase/FAD synthetase [Candidatus Margulisiibacteriota bacterium]
MFKVIKFSKGKVKDIVLALGNFDGIHIGHKKLLLNAVRYAKRKRARCYAMTFEPHPQQVIAPNKNFKLLTTLDERVHLMSEFGVSGIIIKRFDRVTRRISAAQFVKNFLVEGLRVQKVFVGYDFAFGKKREGNVSLLRKLGRQYGFAVNAIKPVKSRGAAVKSSAIRKLIIYGRFNEAVKLLGHSYVLHEKVISGRGTGRKLGFPTANLSTDPDKLIPGYGVYLGSTQISGKKRKCVINIGSRPTFSGDFAIEVHILGFKGHLKGKKLNVELIKKIRDERQFSSVEKLKKQIVKDIRYARTLKI